MVFFFMSGRLYDPTKDYEKLADDYLATCGREQTKLPKVSQFCREYIGANEDTVNLWLKKDWEEKTDKFGAIKKAINKIKEVQKEQLMDDGLYGGKEVNNAMAIFILKANHNMIETERRMFVGGENNEPIEIRIISEDGNRFTDTKLPEAAEHI